MTPEQFSYWLKGFFEISGAETLDKDKVKIIKDHLDTVFTKVTPQTTRHSITPTPMPTEGRPLPHTHTFEPSTIDVFTKKPEAKIC